ncbi:MAG: hypothetical protein WCF99_11615 [Chloroflexales bacterium]
MIQSIRWTRWPLALLVAIFSLSIGWSSALAAPKDNGSKVLVREYARAKKSLLLQDQRLTRMGTFADRVAAVITKAQAKGKDTTAIEQALATFRQQLTSARADWQTASSALVNHTGFDAQGKVTDAVAASATVKTARETMVQVHTTMEGAVKTLRTALKTFRKANSHAASLPEVPEAPVDPTQP